MYDDYTRPEEEKKEEGTGTELINRNESEVKESTGYVNAGSSGTNSANRYEREEYTEYREDRLTGGAYQETGYRQSSYQNTQGAYGRPHYTSYQYSGNQSSGTQIPNPGNTQSNNDIRHKKKKGGFLKKAGVCVALGFLFGIFAGGGFYLINTLTGAVDKNVSQTAGEVKTATSATAEMASATDNTQKKVTTTSAATNRTTLTDVTEVASDVTPAVVAIANDMIIRGRTWFGQEIQQQSEASGSGIIVGENDNELLIVTNEHVVADATELSVQFADGSVAEANLKGQDADSDIAVIAVDFSTLSGNTLDSIKVATLGDSDSLAVGEPVIAIGNALGYGQSVTTGIVSALNREVTLDNGTHTLIQTDAAINPGNSGGALLNINGELIGINEAKAGGSGIEGMGYAIPISTAKPIIEDLMNKTTKKKANENNQGYLGIGGVEVDSDVAQTYDMPEGIYLTQIDEGSGADKAGLTKGDIITKFDGSTVHSMMDLKDMMQYYEAGQTVEVTIQTQEDGTYIEKTVSVTLGKKPNM
ncbi:MAG: trypsin-like peptidase domain-containing protein [Lachnospiraceae bacterium]|nr:trypsin-like peptidase domain-containing protein [Lachnospiraceae bacterium]